MLNLVYGVSGSGKTVYLMDRIREDIQNGKRCYLLVPEQQAYISEFDVPRIFPKNARLYFEVVHFSGLAEKIFRTYGGVTHESLQNGMKSILMWDTLRSLAPFLEEYRQSAGKDAGLVPLMLQAINELRMNGIDSQKLQELSDGLPNNNSLKRKLSDLAMIESTYKQQLDACMGSDLPDRLLRMAEKLEQNQFFAGANVYVDSFTSFTMQEYRVLKQILRQSDTVTLSICMDKLSSTLPHFKSPIQTSLNLLRMAQEMNIPAKKHALLPQNTEKSPVLAMLERDLWRFDLRKENREIFSDEEKKAVKMISCKNLYEEAEAAALNILGLSQRGIPYGEIAVVVRDLEVYRGVLDAALERYEIPYFLSERTDLSSKPLSRLILSALRAISRHYAQQDVITLVKTGLAGVDFSDASMFEEYCETWHIQGSRFLENVWSMNADGLTTKHTPRGDAILDAANKTRKTVIEPLERLSAKMRQSNKLVDRCRALYQYLCELSVSEQLSARAKRELLADQRREAGETLRLYSFVTEALTTICHLLPNTELTTDEFLQAMTLLLSETDLGSVPNTHDCVIIGSAATMRVEKIKAALLLGLCEGEFPATVNSNGILSDTDKDLLEKNFEIVFDSDVRIRSSEELLYVYRAITKPTKQLILSTVSTQIDGTKRMPSLAFTRVAFLLDQKLPQAFDFDEIQAALSDASNETPPEKWVLPRSSETTTLRLSHTKIQTFLQCPYRYYSTYLLKLREQKDSRPSYADDGIFLHYVFEHFLKAVLDKDGTMKIPESDQIDSLADEIIDEYLTLVCPVDSVRLDRHLLHLFARLRTLTLIILRNILAELKESRFVPTSFEQAIGKPGEDGLPAPTWELKDGSRVLLTGVIDRIDILQEDGRVYLRVVDYKSGKHVFKLDQVRSGLDIQLVLYLFSAMKRYGEEAVPAGAQFLFAQKNDKGKLVIQRSGFYADDESVKVAWETESGSFTKGLICSPLSDIQSLEFEMKQAVTAAAERILAGEAQKTPSKDACQFCPIRMLCDKAYHE
ncbi:MAG: hypothetical protein E7637_01765 [Ruminococcaceae bacterium]|nr:hypothetical protein [Oscillospiraceae bacterium]